MTPSARRLHAIALRLFHYRLTLATGLDDQTLMLDCYHPSDRLTAGNMYCTHLGTDGLEDALDYSPGQEVGKLSHLFHRYSRFLPSKKEQGRLYQTPRPGDIPGSRTHPSSAPTRYLGTGPLEVEQVTIDAHEVFSQRCVSSYMAKMSPRRTVIQSLVDISDGQIRIFRDWLTKQVNESASGKISFPAHPSKDSSVLWVNNSKESVGIKFRVRESGARRDNPILFSSDEEVAVSYNLEIEEFVIRTTYLLLKIEQSIVNQHNNAAGNTRAIVFGTIG